MTAPTTSDGAPFASDVIAVLDETGPQMGAGVYYVVTTAVLVDHTAATTALDGFFTDTPGRVRPFHWMREGVMARQRMQDLILELGVVAVSVCESVGRKGQMHARRRLLAASADLVLKEGAGHLVIEASDSATNRVDQQTLLDHYTKVPFTYDWRTKHERVLWIADALGGMIADYLRHADGQTDYDPSPYHAMVDAGVLVDGSPIFHQP